MNCLILILEFTIKLVLKMLLQIHLGGNIHLFKNLTQDTFWFNGCYFEQAIVSIRLFFTWGLCIYIFLDKGCHILCVFGLISTVCSHIVDVHLSSDKVTQSNFTCIILYLILLSSFTCSICVICATVFIRIFWNNPTVEKVTLNAYICLQGKGRFKHWF